MDKQFQEYKDITKEQIAKWKQTKGKLTELSIPLDTKDAKFVICKPPRNILSALAQYGQDGEVEKVNNLLISNCVLGGDMVYLDEDKGDLQVYMTMLDELGKFLTPKQTSSRTL